MKLQKQLDREAKFNSLLIDENPNYNNDLFLTIPCISVRSYITYCVPIIRLSETINSGGKADNILYLINRNFMN